MKKRGYARRVAQPKLPVKPEITKKRVKLVKDHLNWTIDEWKNIPRTDKTWLTDDRYHGLEPAEPVWYPCRQPC